MFKKLDKYELIKKIGEGASSTVYLGRDPFTQRDVAIKVSDFGTAISSVRTDRTQIAGIGSPAYMSPEQIHEDMLDGEPGDFFCFVADGELNASKSGKILNLLTNGDCLGEMAVISQHHNPTRGADVSALTRADIITVRGEALQQASSACRMHFYQSFLDVLSTRQAFANQRMSAN